MRGATTFFDRCTRAQEPYDSSMVRTSRSWFTAWFSLTREERWLAGGMLGLFLLGLTARYMYLKAQTPETQASPVAAEAPLTRVQE